MKKLLSFFLIALLVLTLFPASAIAAPASVSIAFQYGLAYAPLIIMQDRRLIESAYLAQTGREVEIVWQQMSSGADINVGVASGNIQVGFMGVAPAITGVTKHVGYKIFTNLSGQEHGLMVNDDTIRSFADLVGSDHQVALVNIGSIQHILLAKALVEAGYGAHDLDNNLIGMKHPDGMMSLMTGSVAAHVTTNPYICKERESDALHEIEALPNVWPAVNSFIVGVASEEMYENDPELYQAICTAVAQAIDYINNDIEAAAAVTCGFNGNTFEDERLYLSLGVYDTRTGGIEELAKFMYEQAFIENDPGAYQNLVFDNVKGN